MQSFHGRLGGIERPPMATGPGFNASTRANPTVQFEGLQTTKPAAALVKSPSVNQSFPTVNVQRPSEHEQTTSTTPGTLNFIHAIRFIYF